MLPPENYCCQCGRVSIEKLCGHCYQQNQLMYNFFKSGGKLPDWIEQLPHKKGNLDVVTIGGVQVVVDEGDLR